MKKLKINTNGHVQLSVTFYYAFLWEGEVEMNLFKRWLGIVEREPIQILDFKWFHRDLTEKQIVYLEQMISNHRNRGMTICRCDVERVLNMCDYSEVKQK